MDKNQYAKLQELIQQNSQYIPTYKDVNKVTAPDNSFLENVTGNDYDEGYSVPDANSQEFFKDLRTQNQPGTHQAFNAVVGGGLSGLATAVEDLSYIPNIVTQFVDNDYEPNALAEAMQSIKQSLGEEMPIYRSDTGAFSWDDGAVIWDSLKGILDSAVGFGLPGIGIAGTVSKGVSRASKLFKILEGSKALQSAITSVGSGLIMNDLEGTMMGVELYTNLVNSGVDKEVAAQKANEFKQWNRLFAITDALQVHGLFKGVLPGGTRNALNPRGIIANLGKLNESNLLVQGTKGVLEEIGQNVIQGEKEYEGLMESGKTDLAKQISGKDDLFDRILDLATDEKALYEGMLGFFGGGPQRIMSDLIAGNYGKGGQEYDKLYNEQQNLIGETKKTLDKTLEEYSNVTKLISEAESTGEDNLVQALKDSQFTKLMIKNFSSGTAANLENQLEEIVNLSSQEAQQRGLKDNYRTEAQIALNELKRSEKQWNKLIPYNNKEEIFFNIKKGEILDKQFTYLNSKLLQSTTALNLVGDRIAHREINKAIKAKGLPEDINLGITYDINNIDNDTYENPVQKKAYNQTRNYLKKTREYKEFTDVKKQLKVVQDKLEKNDEEYTTITSKEHQNKGFFEKIIKATEEKVKEDVKNLETKLDNDVNSLTSKNQFDELKSSLDKQIIPDKDKERLFDKIDNAYEAKLKEELRTAPKVTEAIDSLDLRYENRPLLLESELKAASEKEDIIFNTLEDYKQYLKDNAKTGLNSIAGTIEPVSQIVTNTKSTDNSGQPETTKPIVESNNINAIINDMAFFEFDNITFTDTGVDDSNTRVTILNRTSARESMSLGEFKKKYSITEPLENWNLTTQYTLKDKDNNPIPSKLNDSNVDLDYLRDGKLKESDEIVYEVDREYNRNLADKIGTVDKFKVLLVKYEGNKRIIVGVLPSYKDGGNSSLKTLREDIWADLNKTKGGNNIYQFPTKTKVKTMYSGKFWNTGVFNDPRKVLKDGQPYILTVAAKNAANKVELIAGYTTDMGNKEIELPNGEKVFIIKDKDESAVNLTEGAVYQIIQAPDGKYYAYRTFTKKVNEMPTEFKDQIKTILNDIYNGTRDFATAKTELEDFYLSDSFSYTPNKGFNWFNEDTKKLEQELTPEQLYIRAEFDNSFVSVKAYSGSQKEGRPFLGANITLPDGKTVNYNEYLAESGIIYTDLNALQNFHSQKFTIDKYERTEKVPDIQFTEDPSDFAIPDDELRAMFNFNPQLLDLTDNQKEVKIVKGIEDKEYVKENKVPEDLGKPKKDIRGKFKFRLSEENQLKKWDKAKETSWFKTRFPNVPIEVLEDLRKIHGQGGIDAHGLFYNAAVYIKEHAGEGTTYHEAFHVVFNMYLDDNQQKAILKEAREKLGFTGDDLKVEEQLADKFMNQVLANEEIKSLPAKIKKFFNDLWRFIKFNVFNKQDIDTLFYSIETNKFFNYPRFKRDVSNLLPRFSNPYGEDLTPFENYQATKMLRDLSYSILQDNRNKYPNADNKEYYALMFDRTNKNNVVLEAYRQLRSVIYSDLGNLRPELIDKPELVKKMNDILNNIYSNGKLGTGYDEVVRSFSTIGIKINDKYDLIEEDAEQNEESGVKGERYSGSYAEENPMDRVSDKMKMWLNSIPNVISWNNSEFDTTVNIFGYPETLPEDYARFFLMENFSNSLSAIDMVNKISKNVDKNLWLNKVVEDLNSDLDLRTDLFQYLQNIKANFIHVSSRTSINFDGSLSNNFIISNSNSSGVVKTILNDWDTGFNSNINRVLNDGKIDVKIASSNYKKLLEINKTLDNKIETLNQISTILEDTGLSVPGAALENLSRDNKAYKIFMAQFVQLYKLISEGENPFINVYENDAELNDKAKLGSANIRKMAEQIKKTYPTYYQPTHVNTEGNKVFNHIRSSFMGKMITKLTNNDENARQEFIQGYINTPFYKDSPFFNALKNNIDGVKDKLSFNIFDGLKREGQDEGVPYSKLSEAQLNVALLNLYYNNGSSLSYYGYPVLSDTGNMVLLGWKKYSKKEALNALYQTALQEWSRINTKNKPKLKNFDKNSNSFVIFPFLNAHKGLFNNLVKNENEIKGLIETYFQETLVNDYFKKLEKWGIVSKQGENYFVKDKQLDSGFGNVNEKITDFVYADTLMQIQSAISFSGDVAYYKSTEDFYKRNKQVWSPGTYIDVTRLDDNTSYKVKVIKDIEVPSRFADSIEKNLIKSGMNEKLAKEKADLYREGVNETDAQAYIDIYSYRQRLKGLARWTDREEESYNRIINNEARNSDLNVILQTLKPFVFTHMLDAQSGLIYPLQLKNSELLLIPQFAEESEQLQTLMTDFGYSFKKGKYTGFDVKSRNVDEIMFESAVKVGLNSELNNWDKISEVSPYLVDYSDYRLQQETPIHHLDDENLLGSQVRKLIVGDIDLEAIYKTPSGKEFTGKALIEEYNTILNKDIEDKYGKLSEKLSPNNLKNVIATIKQEVLDRGLSKQYLDALEVKPDGSTTLPLWHPLIYYKVETMLNSVVKNNGTKLKFNGGSFYNASAFGFDDKLDLVFNEDGSINYFEVMMPAWSKDFVKYATDKDGNLDLKKLEEAGIDTGIVYRIPTENKYSMFRIKVKGFTPEIAGGAIMMPSLITKVAGLDFDIDKVYAMLYNHKIIDKKLVKVDNSLDSQEGRQNYLLDLMSAVLTNKASLSQQLTPGGFATLEKLAKDYKTYTVSKTNTGFFSPNTRTEVFTNMMTGSNNIGIFANMNATHQLFQNAKNFLGFTESIKFDNHELSDLRTFDDITGERKVTDNIAEFLAAAVDNGKNPIAAYLNINAYTADVIGSIVAVGYPIETALAFVNQPVVRKLTEMYYLEKGRISEYNMFKAIEIEFNAKLEAAKGENEAAGKDWNFTTKELQDYIKYNGNTEGRNKRFYVHQSKVLEAFKKYKETGAAYSKLIAATKVADSGPGPTFAETTSKLRKIQKTYTLGFEENLKGASSFFAENTPNNNLWKKFVKDATNNFFNNDNITYVFNEAIQNILDDFEQLKDEDLSTKEIEDIQRNIISFLATGFDTYNSEDSKKVVRNTAQQLLEYKAKKKGKSDFEPFLAYLKVLPNKNKDTQADIPLIIEFDGNTGSNTYVQDTIIDTWEQMLKNGNKEEKELAKDLVRYTFYSAGFNFAPHSFYHIVPVSFFKTLVDSKGESFDSYLKKRIEETKESIGEGNEYLENFKEQFIRNYFQKLSYVKKAVFEDQNRKNVTKIEYNQYKEKSTKPTRNAEPIKIILSEKDAKTSNLAKKEGKELIPDLYIKHNYEGKSYLFRLGQQTKDGFEYYRLPALGLKIRDIGSLEFDMHNGALESKWNFNKVKTSSDLSLQNEINPLSLQKLENMQFEVTPDDINFDEFDIDLDILGEQFEQEVIEQPIQNKEGMALTTNFSRESVKNDNDYIYLFTDNAKRTSGKNSLDNNSWYALKYRGVNPLNYPTMTQAVIRGLDNAFPITTMVDDNRTQWKDSQFDEYKKIIDDEIETIKQAQSKSKGIKFAAQMPFGQGKISNMKQSAPKIWNYLNEKLAEIGIDNTGTTPKFVEQPINKEIKEGYTRLYRAETGKKDVIPDWLKDNPEFKDIQDATGRWFYKTLQEAKEHINKFEPEGKITFVDVKSEDVEKYNAKSNKFSGGYGKEGNEYFLPKEIAKLTQEQPIVEETKEKLNKLPNNIKPCNK